jgi:AraC-like DNA-binding protein
LKALLVIGVFQAILLVLLLVVKRNKSLSDQILSGYLFLSAFIILLAYIEIVNRDYGYPYPWLINLSTPFILLVGPALWLYVKSLTEQFFRFRRLYLLLFIPFAVVLSMLLTRYYFRPDAVKIATEAVGDYKHEFTYLFIVAVIALSNLGYTVWGLMLIKNYRKKIKTYFSKTDSIELNWLRFLLISAMVCYISISILYIADTIFSLLSYNALQIIGYSIASVLVLIIGFFGLKHGSIFVSAPISFNMETAVLSSESSKDLNRDEEAFVHRLLGYMTSSKPHQNPDINLAKLSNDLKVAPEYLSGVLNGRLNMNFFDFINHYRIEEFKDRCKDPKSKNLTLISLAFDCGFNSKATFNRVFKKIVGCTPSEYYNELQNSPRATIEK